MYYSRKMGKAHGVVEEDVACDIVGEKADAGRCPDAVRRDKGVTGAVRGPFEVWKGLGDIVGGGGDGIEKDAWTLLFSGSK